MNTIVLYIKTYRNDYLRFEKLLTSIFKHNKDFIPIYISVNDVDFDFFNENLNHLKEKITLLKDSEIATTNITDGWRYQQIIKSQFYKLGVCKNYLCLDSDSFFINDFFISDFMYDSETPYTIMQESKSLLEVFERINIDTQKESFKTPLKVIRNVMNISTNIKHWDYGPSPYLWSCKVWQIFYEEYLTSKNITIEDFSDQLDKNGGHLAEALIYGEFLRTNNIINIIPCESFFKVYHYKKQYLLEKKHHNLDKLKKIYLGVIFQSNWKKRSFWEDFLKF